MGEESLGRGRQSVAHGVVAAITDARAVDDSEVRVRLGRRQHAAIVIRSYVCVSVIRSLKMELGPMELNACVCLLLGKNNET